MNPIDLIVKTISAPFANLKLPNYQAQPQPNPQYQRYTPPAPPKTAYQQLIEINPTMYAPMKLDEQQAQYYLMRERQHQQKQSQKVAGEQYVEQLWNARHAQASQMASSFVNENRAFEHWRSDQERVRNIAPPQQPIRFG